MALRKRPLAAGIAALLFSGYISALGLGEIRLNSSLNEPLDAEIPLINLGELSEAEIIAGLASATDFGSAGVDREPILTSLVFRLDVTAAGGPVLRVLSSKPIREPYLDFLVDVQWPSGRVLREYTLLLDLPVYAGGSAKKKLDPPLSRPARAPAQSAPPLQVQPQQPVVASDQEYVVRDGDTLWRIASSLGAGADVHEKMAGIYQLNPGAFINGDMNLLKRGAVLRLPDYGSGGSRQARQMDSSGGESAPDAPQLSGSSRGEASYPDPDDSGRLTLSAADADGFASSGLGTQGAAGSRELRGEISAIQEELDRSRRENSELKDRLSSLEQQIATMQRIMEIADDDLRAAQLAGMVEPLPEAGEEATAAAPVEEEDYEAVDSPSLALFPSANVGGSRPRTPVEVDTSEVGSADADSAAVSADTAPPEVGAAEPAAPATVVKTTEPKTEKGWFEKVKGMLMVLLGLLVVAIGAAVFFVLRRGKQADEEVYFPPVQRQAPPPTPVRERLREPPRDEPREQPRAKPTTLDDINLREEDDLFAQPASAPKADEEAAKATASRQESIDEMELDLSEFDLDDGDDQSGQSSSQPATEAAGNLNLDEEFDFLGDIDEGDTQLELAQAYIEMGDHAGAKEILLEVAEGGSDEQKERARQLLGQIG